MSKGKLIKVCGECANYDWKKHRCRLGCNEGEPQEPFYTDCPLPTVDTDQVCKQSEGENEYKKLYEQLLEDFEHALYFAGKNNNVCNFCEHDCGEGGTCKGRDDWTECSPKWRGIVKGGAGE